MKQHRLARPVATLLLGGLIFTTAPVSSTTAAPPPLSCSERAEGGAAIGYGLTADQRVVCFKLSRPSVRKTLMSTARLSGSDTVLVGIDVRPSNGILYGLGDAGGVYELDLTSDKPTFKSRLNVALQGQNFGVDFNPTVDRLRIVSDSGQNLRANIDTGAATIDTNLAVTTGTTLRGVGGIAYTNNDNDPSTATTLYDLDSLNDQLVTQNPPNNGTIVPGPRLGFDTSGATTFDISSELKDGKAIANSGYVALDGGGTLYAIDLTTGSLRFMGNFESDRLIGLALPM